jgi:protein-arginine kinase activator protein McsA
MKGSHEGNHKNILKRPTEIQDKQNVNHSEICEICGRKLERDPESGELYCPDCYYSENQG